MTLERDDIQGLLLTGYGKKPCSRFLLRRVHDARAFARWLGAVEVTSAADTSGAVCVNLALAFGALRALGANEADFPEPFCCGMASPRGRRVLADEADWRWSDGDAGERVDVAVLVYADEAEVLDARCAALDAELCAAGAPAALAPLSPLDMREIGKIEHFGFRDGIAQPRFDPDADDPPDTAIGDFALGYPDAHGDALDAPLLRNGSFLVLRELHQDARAFWRGIAEAAGGGPEPTAERLRLAARMVGRWPSGAPVVRYPDADPGEGHDTDDFGYAGDSHGHACPLGAHVRRMHPRDWLMAEDAATARALSARHRILRRGRPFGAPTGQTPAQMARRPDDIPEAERGIYFLCLNADIERQFEFLQQTWGNNAKFAGLYADPDPLVGAAATRCFTQQAQPVRRVCRSLPPVIRARGGGYFLLPGIRALRALARGGASGHAVAR